MRQTLCLEIASQLLCMMPFRISSEFYLLRIRNIFQIHVIIKKMLVKFIARTSPDYLFKMLI